MHTLPQIRDCIESVRKELVVFESKRAMLRKIHLELVSFCWFDGMEIDHDAVPTDCPNLDNIDNEINATIIAIDLYSRTVATIEKLRDLISDDYGKMFADAEDEFVFFAKKENDPDEKNREILNGFRKIRNFFPPVGGECALWKHFCASDKVMLHSLLSKADEAIAQGKGQELRCILSEIFTRQASVLKSQIQERLCSLKTERNRLIRELPNMSGRESAEKCGKPYWVEVSGSENLFVKNNAFPVPIICAKNFVAQEKTEIDEDIFHYKRPLDDTSESPSMRIFGFSSEEEFEGIVKQWDVSNKHCDEIEWARWIISKIDDYIHYGFSNELLPQWKEVLDKAVDILEEKDEKAQDLQKGKRLLELPVLELRKV